MTAPLFAAHPGGHCAPPSPLALFFRRLVAAWRRKQAAPEVPSTPSGAATALLADAEPVMRDRMISEVREQWNAWHDGLSDTEIAALAPRRVLPREDGDVIIDQRERVHLRPWDYPWPRAEKPAWAQPPEPHRADDTRVDLRIARPYAPQAVYGEKPVADVLEGERLARRVIA